MPELKIDLEDGVSITLPSTYSGVSLFESRHYKNMQKIMKINILKKNRDRIIKAIDNEISSISNSK